MPWGRYSSRYKEQQAASQQQQAPTPQEVRLGPGAPPRAIAKRKFGEATVTCCIRGAQSKWGKHQQQDAAILHFMISASQPPDFKLHVFQLKAEFSTTQGSAGAIGQPAALPEPELYLFDQPSPKWVGGDLSTRRIALELNAQPAVEAGGVGVGLGNVGRTEERDVQRSWIFRSGWDSDPQGVYNVASWIWEANTDNPQVDDRGALYGALALRYPAQPFYLSSSVQGRLVKEKSLNIFKLASSRGVTEPCTVRLTPVSSNEDLEDEVRGLEEQVVQLNLQPAARMGRE